MKELCVPHQNEIRIPVSNWTEVNVTINNHPAFATNRTSKTWAIRINAQNPYVQRNLPYSRECYSGLYIDVLLLFSAHLNVGLTLSPSIASENNNTALGITLVRELLDGTIKIGVDNPVITPERLAVYSILSVEYQSEFSLLVHKNQMLMSDEVLMASRIFGCFTKFSGSVWIASACALIGWSVYCSVQELTIQKLFSGQPEPVSSREGLKQFGVRIIWNCFTNLGTCLGQHESTGSSIQTFGSFLGNNLFLFSGITLSALFCAKLTLIFCAAKPVPPFATLDEFATSDFRLIAINSSTSRNIKDHPLKKFNQFASRMDLLNYKLSPTECEEIAQKMASEGKYAVLMTTVRATQLSKDSKFALRIAVPKFLSLPIGMFLLNKADRDRKHISKQLDNIVQYGILEHLFLIHGFKDYATLEWQRIHDYKNATSVRSSITLARIEYAFWLWLLGILCSFTAYIFEVIIQFILRKRTKRYLVS